MESPTPSLERRTPPSTTARTAAHTFSLHLQFPGQSLALALILALALVVALALVLVLALALVLILVLALLLGRPNKATALVWTQQPSFVL